MIWRLVAACFLLVGAASSHAIVDANTNGLSDVWETIYGPGPFDPGADLDGDGQNNFQEAVAGTDPRDACSVFRATATELLNSAQLVRWRSVAGIRYQVEGRTSETALWESCGRPVLGTGEEVLAAFPVTEPRTVFFRLRVLNDNPAVEMSRPFLGTVDTDGDAWPDIDEFAAGTNPFDPDDRPSISSINTSRALHLTWPSIVGKCYQVQSSTNLVAGAWNPVGGPLAGTGEIISTVVEVGPIPTVFHVQVLDADSDLDTVTNWEETMTNQRTGSPNEGAPPNLPEGLISYWRLDEPTGADRADSCHGNTLADLNRNVAQGNEARLGQSAWFDYTPNKLLAATNAPGLNVTNFTLTAWVKLGGTSGHPEYDPQHIAGKATGNTKEFSLDYTGITFNRFRVAIGTNSVNSTLSLQSDTWYFVCARYDGTNLSVSVNNRSEGVTNAVPPPAFTPTPFTVGARSNGSNPFYGYIDEVALWNRALSYNEVAQVMAASPLADPPVPADAQA
ncbi:MAG TPA: LamG domain-containing protein, partial [Verrucomicrobiota bacterium]|nr:LamG domain-containing protein [Verrucomicrobiota bacterium]